MPKNIKSKISIGIVSLGCPKTLVDSEVILGKVQGANYEISQNPNGCDIVFLNTCGFIKDAKEESIDEIIRLIELKKQGRVKAVVVLGCLVQRYAQELQKEFPQVDAFIGSGDYMRIAETLKKITVGEKFTSVHRAGYLADSRERRISLTLSHSRYLKISEGCNHTCAFCIIPKLRGKHRSRRISDIIQEANKLAEEGAKELVIIGQDITRFGWDFAGRTLLPELLHELEKIRSIKWIRLLYTYPSTLSDRIIKTIAKSKKICRYVDLPLQHISNKILKSMRRGNTKHQAMELIQKLREQIPDVVLRTSFIVGFPGETDEDFDELLEFMNDVKFDRLGVFKYSAEEGTLAASYPDQVSEKIKDERYHRAMSLQQKISHEANKRFLNKEMRMLIETQDAKNAEKWTGRAYSDAPDIDGNVIISTKRKLEIGKFYTTKITETYNYDLFGTI